MYLHQNKILINEVIPTLIFVDQMQISIADVGFSNLSFFYQENKRVQDEVFQQVANLLCPQSREQVLKPNKNIQIIAPEKSLIYSIGMTLLQGATLQALTDLNTVKNEQKLTKVINSIKKFYNVRTINVLNYTLQLYPEQRVNCAQLSYLVFREEDSQSYQKSSKKNGSQNIDEIQLDKEVQNYQISSLNQSKANGKEIENLSFSTSRSVRSHVPNRSKVSSSDCIEYPTIQIFKNGANPNLSNIPKGHGSLKLKNGSEIRGNFVNGYLQGQGYFLSYQGEEYSGNFKNNLFDGRGILKGKKYTYHGDFKEGMKHGFGYMIFANGKHLEGQFKKDKLIKKVNELQKYELN